MRREKQISFEKIEPQAIAVIHISSLVDRLFFLRNPINRIKSFSLLPKIERGTIQGYIYSAMEEMEKNFGDGNICSLTKENLSKKISAQHINAKSINWINSMLVYGLVPMIFGDFDLQTEIIAQRIDLYKLETALGEVKLSWSLANFQYTGKNEIPYFKFNNLDSFDDSFTKVKNCFPPPN